MEEPVPFSFFVCMSIIIKDVRRVVSATRPGCELRQVHYFCCLKELVEVTLARSFFRS